MGAAHASLVFNNRTGLLSLHIDNMKVSDDVLKETNAFSIADVMPGAIAVGVSLQPLSDQMCANLHEGIASCNLNMYALSTTLVPSNVFFSFDDPTSIEIDPRYAVHCVSKQGRYIVLPFLDAIGSAQKFRFRSETYSRGPTKADENEVCIALEGELTTYTPPQ
jgi:hypothetical protein